MQQEGTLGSGQRLSLTACQRAPSGWGPAPPVTSAGSQKCLQPRPPPLQGGAPQSLVPTLLSRSLSLWSALGTTRRDEPPVPLGAG